MRGIKRKIPLEKIEKKDSRAVAFSKRSKGLYSKASELCLLSGGQIAVINTPVSANSNVSFYSFGHSSVDTVVTAFLANKRPRDDLGLEFWWEDESLVRSENPEELRQAINSMSKILQDLKDLRLDHEDVKKKGVLHGTTHQKQNLDVQTSSASNCIKDNTRANFEGFNKNTEEEQILAISDNNNNNQELGLLTTNQKPLSDSEVVEGGELVMHNKDWYENNLHFSDFDENQILSISENNNNVNEALCDQDLDLDQICDFETNCESLILMNEEKMNGSEAVEDGGSVIHRDLDEDNLNFSDFFNELDSITQL